MFLDTGGMRTLALIILLVSLPCLVLGQEAQPPVSDEPTQEPSGGSTDGEAETEADSETRSAADDETEDEADSEAGGAADDETEDEADSEAGSAADDETEDEVDSTAGSAADDETVNENDGTAGGEAAEETQELTPPRRVLNLGDVELSLDFKLFAHYEIDVASPEVDNGFYIMRAYLGFRLRFTSWLSGRVTYDVSQLTDVGSAGEAPVVGEEAVVDASRAQGSMMGRLKYAYLDFVIPRISMHVRGGIIQTPYIDWMEHIELTRFLRKIMFENEYHHPSADFGLAVLGDIGDYVSYHLGVYNGEGYHGLESARFKDVIGRLSLRPAPGIRALSGLALTGYFRVELPVSSDEDGDTLRRFGGALTYRLADEVTSTDTTHVHDEIFAIWVQAFYGQNVGLDEQIDSWGISSGIRGELPARLFLTSRLDYFDPNTRSDGEGLWTVLGVIGFHVVRGVNLALDYQGRLGPGRNAHVIALHAEMVL